MVTFIGAIVLTAGFGARLVYDAKVLMGAMLILVACILAFVGWPFFPHTQSCTGNCENVASLSLQPCGQ
jgi:hypothetical protein